MQAYGNNYGVINKDNGVEFYFELDLVIWENERNKVCIRNQVDKIGKI